MQLDLDAWNNRLTVDGMDRAPRTRWSAALLQTLVEQGRRHGGLTREELERALARHGRSLQPLQAKQAQRLVDGLRAVFAGCGQAGAFDQRFVCPPKGKTTGPWRWVAAPGDRTVFRGPTAAGGAQSSAVATRLPAIAEPPDDVVGVALAAEMKQVLAYRWDGQPDLAIELLSDSSRWRHATPELGALRWFKLGELLAARREYANATKAFVKAEVLLQGAPWAARAALDSLLAVQRGLASYSQQPAARYQAILDGELVAGDPQRASAAECNPYAEAKRLNLVALCQRRWLETHRLDATEAQWAEHTEALLRQGQAALFLCLVTEQFERSRNVCANMAYAHQQLARWAVEVRGQAPDVGAGHLRCAIEWYAVSMSFHWRFELPDNLAFLYIFLGELWLSAPAAREAFEAAWLRLAWDGERPDDAAFYRKACECAQQVGDPRQLAYAALNKLRFGEIMHSRSIKGRATRLLKAVLGAHPDLLPALRAEGYVVPDDLAVRR